MSAICPASDGFVVRCRQEIFLKHSTNTIRVVDNAIYFTLFSLLGKFAGRAIYFADVFFIYNLPSFSFN